GDQRRVMVRQHRAVALDEVDQGRDLLEVGEHVRVVPREVDVVEGDVDDVLDAVAELARLERRRRGARDRGGRRGGAGRRARTLGGGRDLRGGRRLGGSGDGRRGAGGGRRGRRGGRRERRHHVVHAAFDDGLEGRRGGRAGAVGRRRQLGHRRGELALGLRAAGGGIGTPGRLLGQASQLGRRLLGGGGDLLRVARALR